MRKLLTMVLTAGTMMAAGTFAAHAQTTCKGKVSLDSVYQTSKGAGNYEYFVQLRNASNAPVTATVQFAMFPREVSLFSSTMPNIVLKPYGNQTLKFGTGTLTTINLHTVQISYDRAASGGSKPSVLVDRCR